MFLESTFPQGIQTRIPWNVRSSLTSIVDGASTTILMSENTLTGVQLRRIRSRPTSKGTGPPDADLNMFIGSSAMCGVPSNHGLHGRAARPCERDLGRRHGRAATWTGPAGRSPTRSGRSRTSTAARI